MLAEKFTSFKTERHGKEPLSGDHAQERVECGQRGNALVDMHAHTGIPVANARAHLGDPSRTRRQGEPADGRDPGIPHAKTSHQAGNRPRVGALGSKRQLQRLAQSRDPKD